MRADGSSSHFSRSLSHAHRIRSRRRLQSLVMNSSDFTHILRVLSTNVDGKQKVSFAMTAIKGVGRRFADVCCKKADIDVQKRCTPSKSSSSD